MRAASSIDPPLPAADAPWFGSLIWLNLLGLDAPIVAVCWQWIFAYAFDVTLNGAARATLFLTAWLIYLVDRVGDSYALKPKKPKARRHAFCRRHRSRFLAAIAVLAAADGAVAFRLDDIRTFAAGVALLAGAAAYLAITHRSPGTWRKFPCKELVVGLIFAVGTVLAVATRLPHLSADFILLVALFAAECLINLIAIATWEYRVDEAQGRASLLAHWPLAGKRLSEAASVVAGLALVAGYVIPGLALISFALCVSALLLAALLHFGDHLPRDLRTALADLVLLTPLFVLVVNLVP